MKLELLPQIAPEAARVWEMLPGSPLQKVLHNELVSKILELRGSLEEAKPEQVLEIQAAIRAHKFLFGLIYRNNPLPTR